MNEKTPFVSRVIVKPREQRDAEHPFAIINQDALREAMKKLNGSGLKLWLYLNKNQEYF